MNIAESGNWSGGFIAAVIFLILAVLAGIIFLLFALGSRNSYYEDGAIFGVGSAIAFGIAIIIAGALFPWSGEYHQYREVSGTVAEIGERLVSSGDNGMEQKFVVRFEGSEQEFRVDDTRAALMEEGGELTVKCIKEWSYSGTDGYICKWGSYSAAE